MRINILAVALLVVSFSAVSYAVYDCNGSTLAVWHMDAIVDGNVADDDSATPGRDNDLAISGPNTLITGTVGNAIHFDSNTTQGLLLAGWGSEYSVKVELDFKADSNENYGWLISAKGVWVLWQELGDVVWTTYDAHDGEYSVRISDVIADGQWHHVVASISEGGVSTLTVTGPGGGTESATVYASPLKLDSKSVCVGKKDIEEPPYRNFVGALDEIKVSIPTNGLVGDADEDCDVDLGDFTFLAEYWLANNMPPVQ